MGSPLTFTLANACMQFVEHPNAKRAKRRCSIYYRYIDDLFSASNVRVDSLKGFMNF